MAMFVMPGGTVVWPLFMLGEGRERGMWNCVRVGDVRVPAFEGDSIRIPLPVQLTPETFAELEETPAAYIQPCNVVEFYRRRVVTRVHDEVIIEDALVTSASELDTMVKAGLYA